MTGDGRIHIKSDLARTKSKREHQIMPNVVLVGIGGQSIFGRGRDALLPLVAELAEARKSHRRCSASVAARG